MTFLETGRLLITGACLYAGFASATDLEIGDAMLRLDDRGRVESFAFGDGVDYCPEPQGSFCFLESPDGESHPTSVLVRDEKLDVKFRDGSTASFSVKPGDGFAMVRLDRLDLKSSATAMRLFRLPVPEKSRVDGTLNGAFYEGKSVALMSANPEVLTSISSSQATSLDKDGCSHSFTQTTHSKLGKYAAAFAAKSDATPAGWSMQGRVLQQRLLRKPMAGLRVWVHGDGKGQQLKLQLMDDAGEARDYYVPIDFTGWRQLELTQPALDNLRGDFIKILNIYYNGLPKSGEVVCLLDDIQAVLVEDGTTRTVALEDFEEPNSSWWTSGSVTVNLEMDFRYAGVGSTFGIVACAEPDFFNAVERFEKAAGILTPYPGGTWNKRSAAAHENYLFLTSFSEQQFEEALALARRGGFKRVLLGQESWCQSTGHYEIKRSNFADGLPGLKRTMERFRENGIEVGLHLLGASIDWNDPYITPKPDRRLVKDGQTTLTADLDPATTTIVVEAMPEGFPAEDGGYMGDGTVLWIGDELIKYSSRSTTAPYTFSGCVRGHLGTTATAHTIDEPVHHLARAYGYHMFDMDTDLLDEVTSNFARIANECDIDMVYFDGSEALQGDHRRYNARLINAYLSKLKRKDILVQASSFSHFSWHQLARSASADGHGDLKGYLEQRSPAFESFKQIGMPLDIGWYYGYDTAATPDMYEYILGTSIGYDSAFSYQVSVPKAKEHPFTGRILDLINKYQELRLDNRVTTEMRERLRVPKELQGKAPEDKSRPTHLRRDYHLAEVDGKEVFQRVVYGEWQTVEKAATGLEWHFEVTTGPVVVSVEIQALAGPAGQVVKAPWVEVAGTRFTWDGVLAPGQYLLMEPGKKMSVYGAPLTEAELLDVDTPDLAIVSAQHRVKFGCAEGSSLPVRVRVNVRPPEQWPVYDDDASINKP